jgi:hypothetical protein
VSAVYGIVQLLTGMGVITVMPYGVVWVIAFLSIIFGVFVAFSIRIRRHAFSFDYSNIK